MLILLGTVLGATLNGCGVFAFAHCITNKDLVTTADLERFIATVNNNTQQRLALLEGKMDKRFEKLEHSLGKKW